MQASVKVRARRATNGFAFRPGEPTNPRAWLGVAPLVMAKRFPILTHDKKRLYMTRPIVGIDGEELLICLDMARTCEPQWRRVLLPMLLEEAKRRGLDV